MKKERLFPEGREPSPDYSEGIRVSGPRSTIYIGGQNSVDAEGQVLAEGDFYQQCVLALNNVEAVLHASGCTIDHVVKWTVYILEGMDPYKGFQAFQGKFGAMEIPAAITVIQVAGFALPSCLVEIEAIAEK